MSQEYIETLQAMVKDLHSLSSEKLQAFIGETVTQLVALQAKLTSKDQKVREEGQALANTLKQALEAQMEEVCRMVGATPDQLNVFAGEFTEETATLDKAKEKIMHLNGHKNGQKSKKDGKINLVG